jgi:hypothetical protein
MEVAALAVLAAPLTPVPLVRARGAERNGNMNITIVYQAPDGSWQPFGIEGLEKYPDVPTAEKAMHALEAEHPQLKFRLEVGD